MAFSPSPLFAAGLAGRCRLVRDIKTLTSLPLIQEPAVTYLEIAPHGLHTYDDIVSWHLRVAKVNLGTLQDIRVRRWAHVSTLELGTINLEDGTQSPKKPPAVRSTSQPRG